VSNDIKKSDDFTLTSYSGRQLNVRWTSFKFTDLLGPVDLNTGGVQY